MNRLLTALFAAFEALLVVAIGIGISLAPLTVLWAVHYGFAPDWAIFWRASVDIWLLGHGTDITVTLDSDTAAGLGLVGAAETFTLTLAALGFTLLTLLLGVRAGRRVGETDHRALGTTVAVAVFALLCLGASLSAVHPLVEPSIPQAVLLPTLAFTIGLTIGRLRTAKSTMDDSGSSIRDWIDDWRPATRGIVATALRGGAAVVALVIACASVLTAFLIMTGYAEIIALYEGLHTGILGGLAITIAQLALLPNLVIWAASWLVGPGFAIGAGSSVSPLATSLGPLPAVPVFGALPAGDLMFGFVGLLVPVLAAFFVAVLLRSRLGASFDEESRVLRLAITGVAMGVVGGVILGLLAWMSSGAAGPGRLAVVGPDPVQVALWAALEFSVAATLGLLTPVSSPIRR